MIPITRINATILFEKSNAALVWWMHTAIIPEGYSTLDPVTEANTSASSYAAYIAAVADAKAELARLYDAEGNPTDYNSSVEGDAAANVQAAETALNEAIAGLDSLTSGENAKLAYDSMNNLANRIFTTKLLNEDDYTADSWAAFIAARDEALAFYSSHSSPAEQIGWNEGQEYVDAYCALWDACYEGLIPANAGTAILCVEDVYSLTEETAVDESAMFGGTYSVSIPVGGMTLDALLQSKLGSNYAEDLHAHLVNYATGIFLNGIYLFNMELNSTDNTYVGSLAYEDVVIKPGDEILVARMRIPYSVNMSGGATVERAGELVGDIQYLTISGTTMADLTVEAEAGSDIELNTKYMLSMVNGYTGAKTAKSGAKVYISDCNSTSEAALAAKTSVATDVATSQNGDFSLTLYAAAGSNEGWYVINLIDPGEKGGVVCGMNILIHVTDPDDLSTVRAQLKEQLDEVYTAYDDEFYTEAQLAKLKAFYDAAIAVFENESSTSGDLYAAYETAYEGITAIQAENEVSLSKNLGVCRELLKYLPNAEDTQAGKIYNIDKMVLDLLFGESGWYTRLTPYQKKQFSSSESALISALEETYNNSNSGADLPQIPSYTLKIEIRDIESKQVVALPIFDYVVIRYYDSFFYNESLDQLETPERIDNIFIDEASATYSLPTECIYIMNVTSGPDYSELGDYEVVGFEFSFDEHYLVTPDGVDTYTLRENATKTIYVQLSNPEAAALKSAKEAALAELETAFNSYTRSNYSDENWTALRAAYQNGVSSIEAAETVDAVQTALVAAKDAMAAVPKKAAQSPDAIPGWGAGDAFDAGTKVGTVTVTVENNTFPGGAFTGMILNQPDYAIGENDNMMTVILRALADAEFDWEGTGGATPNGFDISYLAKIKKDGQEMGEFSGDPGSGWMGALNEFMVNEGFSQFSVASGMLGDGDVISVMFTQNLGVDLGGSWGNSDTTLKSLDVSTGTPIPGFASGQAGNTYDFALMIPGSSASILVTPHAANINYMVKTFLNEKVTSNAIGNSFYRRTETINVHPGDVIYVGCGERAWPSMNKQGDEATAYTGTWYALHVISANDGADYVNELIAKLPAGNKITLSNYKNVLEQIAVIDQVKAALSSSEQAKVNTSTLEAARERAESFKAVDEVKALLAALPKSSNLSDSEVVAARRQIEAADAAYKALTDEQKGYITVGDVANYNELVERLTKLTPDTTAETITGSTATGDEVTVSAEAIKEAADENGNLAVETENGTVKLDAATLDALAETGEDVVVSVTENEDGTVTVDVTVDGETIDADVKVELPATGEGQVLVIVNPDGTEEIIKKSLVEDGTVYAELPAGATVKVIDNAMHFIDVADNAWYADEVEFASSHGLFQGVGNNKFAPAAPMTRAMLATVLYRLEDAVATGANPFADVADGTWYTEAVIWASAEGIVQGTGKGFEPNENITREQIATMLYRYAKTIGLDVSGSAALDKFSDGDKTSSWAKDAMQWAVSVGLFQGDDVGTLRPQGDATRAEVAALLMRMVKLIVK